MTWPSGDTPWTDGQKRMCSQCYAWQRQRAGLLGTVKKAPQASRTPRLKNCVGFEPSERGAHSDAVTVLHSFHRGHFVPNWAWNCDSWSPYFTEYHTEGASS